jgi:hypothetical protein
MKALPFRLDTLGNLPGMVPPGARAVSADLKNGYYHVQLHTDFNRYFGFRFKGEVYVYTVLPFGWSPAVFVFQEFTDCIVTYMRACAYPCVVYIDDFLASS